MKKAFLLLLSVALFAGLGGCSKGSDGGSEPPVVSGDTPIEQYKSIMEHMVKIMDAAEDDAAKAASSLEKFYTKNEAVIKQIKGNLAQIETDLKDDSNKQVYDALMGTAAKLALLVDKFKDNANFKEVYDKLKLEKE